ncbi:MAG: ATP-binding cassette domain-containing protein [Planctomycetes bacterium]|nr:ATP-binding cassette domain-containing protein [Planctomycetota bacterium]
MIEVKELRKAFGPIVAVDSISFAVGKGDVLGFLGPNGAGKSTTMKLLSCFMPPDSGTANISGHDIRKEPVAVRQSLGYVAENAPAYDEMTTESFLKFVCDARGLKARTRKEALGRVAEMCAIGGVMHQPIGTLSKGYRRRVGLAQALVHDPDVLLLDEPTDGLDPNQKHDVRKLITEMAARKCIIISTHILEEVEAICNRIIIIDRGEILVDSTPKQLREREHGSLEEIFRKLTTQHLQLDLKGGAA